MTNVLIRNLPDDVHAVLTRRAQSAGQSVQQYLYRLVVIDAATPTLDEVMADIGTNTGGRIDLTQVIADLEAERSRR
jgi:plasmid stability protein